MSPTTRSEYEKRFYDNQKIVGFGMETGVIMPCPFCAAPDFISYKIISMEEDMTKGAFCKECKRGMKTEYTRSPNSVIMRMIQTSGPPVPEEWDWVPKMERIESN